MKRINALILSIERNGHVGIGKPELLKKYARYWSRCINEKAAILDLAATTERCPPLIAKKVHFQAKKRFFYFQTHL